MSKKLIKRVMRLVYKNIDKPQHNFKHFAFLAKRNKIIAMGYCKAGTHPESPALFKQVHAEFDCKLRCCIRPRMTMVCVRVNAQGELRLSKPCSVCAAILSEMKLRKLLYSYDEGFCCE